MGKVMNVQGMKLITGKAAIEAAIKSILTRGKKLDSDIHVAGVSCLNHIELHGDITLAVRLIDSMPKGSRVNALREWMNVHGKLRYNAETKEWSYAKDKTTLLEEAIATSWTEFKPETAYRPLDFETELTKLITKAFERVQSKKGDKINIDTLKQVANAIGYKKEAK